MRGWDGPRAGPWAWRHSTHLPCSVPHSGTALNTKAMARAHFSTCALCLHTCGPHTPHTTRYLCSCSVGEGNATQDVSIETKAAAKELLRSCHLNLAAAQLKLKEWGEAAKHCSEVLLSDPANVKALYRRAQALMGSADLIEAERDVKAGLGQEPQHAELLVGGLPGGTGFGGAAAAACLLACFSPCARPSQ